MKPFYVMYFADDDISFGFATNVDAAGFATIVLDAGNGTLKVVSGVAKGKLAQAPCAADFTGLDSDGGVTVGCYFPTTDPEVKAPAKLVKNKDGTLTGEAYGPSAPVGGFFISIPQAEPSTTNCWILAPTTT